MNTKKTNQRRQKAKQTSSRRGRVRTSSNLADRLPEGELHAIAEGAKFSYAQPFETTEFRKAFEERCEFFLRCILENERAEREQARKRKH